ncbi:MAG: hypothetical protein ACFFE1_10320 [Candidatus Thorarchaeota archaeon]
MTKIEDPNQSPQNFDFEIKPYYVEVITVPMKKGNVLRLYGKTSSQSVLGAPKIWIHLVHDSDRPPETLSRERQRDILRQKAFRKRKISREFEVEYVSTETETILLVFDNNNPVATRSVNGTIQIVKREYKEEPKQPAAPIPVTEKTVKRVLGVLKSFQTVSMEELTSYSSLGINETRNIVFELIAEDKVTGRFDSKSDSFISASAASASREIRSDQQSIARCMYCGNPLEKALKSGDEVKCPSCEIINIG